MDPGAGVLLLPGDAERMRLKAHAGDRGGRDPSPRPDGMGGAGRG